MKSKTSTRNIALIVVAVLSWLMTATFAMAETTDARCVTLRQLGAAKLLTKFVKCTGKYFKSGDVAAKTACDLKAASQFSAFFTKTEIKNGCVTVTDSDLVIQSLVEATNVRLVTSVLHNIIPVTTTTLPSGYYFSCDFYDSSACLAFKNDGFCNQCMTNSQTQGSYCSLAAERGCSGGFIDTSCALEMTDSGCGPASANQVCYCNINEVLRSVQRR